MLIMINGYQRPLTLVAILRKESVLNAFLPVTKMKKSMVSLCFMLSVLKSVDRDHRNTFDLSGV